VRRVQKKTVPRIIPKLSAGQTTLQQIKLMQKLNVHLHTVPEVSASQATQQQSHYAAAETSTALVS
jgi:hypothetical protein